MSWVDAARGQEVRLVMSSGCDPEIRRARQLHTEVYVENGFLADGVNWLDLDTGLIEDPWVDASDYVAVFDDVEPIGVARLIRPAAEPGLPAFENFEILPAYRWIDPHQCLEISSFAIGGPSTVYSGVFAHLFRGFLDVTVRRRERYWVGIVERPLLRVMQRYYHLPFEVMGPSHRFMGGETMPVMLDVPTYVAGLDGLRYSFLTDTIDGKSLASWLERHLSDTAEDHVDIRVDDGVEDDDLEGIGPEPFVAPRRNNGPLLRM